MYKQDPSLVIYEVKWCWTDLSEIPSVDLQMTCQRQHVCFSAPQTSLFSIAGDANGDCACSKLPTVLHPLNYLRRDAFTLCTWCLRIKKPNTFICRVTEITGNDTCVSTPVCWGSLGSSSLKDTASNRWPCWTGDTCQNSSSEQSVDEQHSAMSQSLFLPAEVKTHETLLFHTFRSEK